MYVIHVYIYKSKSIYISIPSVNLALIVQALLSSKLDGVGRTSSPKYLLI